MKKQQRNNTTAFAMAAAILIAVFLLLGTLWMGSSAKRDNENAVRAVSLLYLDELAGRREQVIENNLRTRIRDLRTAVELMEEKDLSSEQNLQEYQSRMKRLYTLDKFAFVDTDGVIYTSQGRQHNIDEYDFDYRTLSEPSISVFNLRTPEKTVIIAVPVQLQFEGKTLSVCFMEINMQEMLAGVSMESNPNDSTFCNLYTKDGVALSDTILGGLAMEDNLLEALKTAQYEGEYSFDHVAADFEQGNKGVVSFTYKGITETLSYVPVAGTDWLLTYLIRESVISEQISSISSGIINKSIVQSVLTLLAVILAFAYILSESRKSARLVLERETAEAEVRGKQEELERRIALQEKLEQQSQVLSDALTAAEEANKAKTAFLSNMSHEIRTPMNAIIGLDNIALSDPGLSPKTRGYLEKIGASADHLLGLINDILDMSRIESGRMTLKHEEFSFPKLIETINTMFGGQCAEKGLEYNCLISSDVDDYYVGDSMKLKQVLINILGNAVKFTPEGGSVTLDVKRTASFDGKAAMQFTISDTGIGMSREFLPHIFDSFAQEDNSTTNKYGSSGLGMSITKSFVEMMNGQISVESEKGKGSVFTVTVPLEESKRKGQETTSVRPEDMLVLVVDDDPVACEHARLVLEKAGIRADTVLSGAEAVEKVRMQHARRTAYNLILVDWQMPEMDGIETTRQIRNICGDESAIIILTAYRWDDVLEEALQAGVDSFISKPLFAGTVMDEFSSAVTRRTGKGNTHKAELNGRKILLAEDVQINAEIIEMILETKGITVDHAVNGREAVDKFAASEEGYYDAVLMDMRMPEMDGLEATRTIRAMDRKDAKEVPVIALTANAFDEDVQRSLQAGLNAHLSKPVQAEKLFETLESLIKD